MKILHTVQLYPPSVGGMQEVVRQISERLVRRGHEVTVATTKLPERKQKIIGGVRIVEFDVSGNLVQGISGEARKYQDFLINSDFDIITNFAAQQWATDLMLPLLDRIKAKKVFVPTGFSGLYLPEYKQYFESMKVWMKKYDVNVFISNNYRDTNFARTVGIKKMVFIPNGASADEFLSSSAEINIRQKLGIPLGHFLIIHVGSHTGLKGHIEAIEIFKRARISRTSFLLIGNDFGNGCAKLCEKQAKSFNRSPLRLCDRKRIILASLSREETIEAFKGADLFLFPSNIECSPLVLFECMASRTPFLTTDVGNAAEIIEWSNGAGQLLPTIKDVTGYCRADIASSAKMLEDLYKQPEKRKAMQEAGFSAWIERFTWETIAESYERLYWRLLTENADFLCG